MFGVEQITSEALYMSNFFMVCVVTPFHGSLIWNGFSYRIEIVTNYIY